jgi:hypothetical protein
MAKIHFSGKAVWLFVLMFFGILNISRAQESPDINARSPHPTSSGRKQKQAEKKKVEQKKLAEKAIEKGKKRHEKLQTREVRKRMKKSKHKAAANNAHQREFFLKRWFTPGQKKKSR